jgi:hypothetical protein
MANNLRRRTTSNLLDGGVTSLFWMDGGVYCVVDGPIPDGSGWQSCVGRRRRHDDVVEMEDSSSSLERCMEMEACVLLLWKSLEIGARRRLSSVDERARAKRTDAVSSKFEK